MGYRTLVAVAVTLLLKSTNGQNAGKPDTNVVQLDNTSFPAVITKGNSFVMFYAPWCGHCQKLKPVWEELADHFSAAESGVTIAKVDCTTDSPLCSEHDVTGYPTLKLFLKDSTEPQRHRGPRDLASLISFVTDNTGAKAEAPKDEPKPVKADDDVEAAKPLEGAVELTESTFKDHVAAGDHFVKFYAPWCGHCQKMAPTWDNLAQSVGHDTSLTIAKVDCTQHRTLCNDFEVKGYPTLLWIKDGKKTEKYQGSRTHEDLKNFIERMKSNKDSATVEKPESNEVPQVPSSAVVQLVESNFENGIAKGFTFVKFYAPWCGHCKRLAPTWDELGTKFVGNSDIKIAKVDCTDGTNRQLCSQQKVNGFPTIFLYSDGKKIEEYDGSRSLDDMFEFVSKNMKPQTKDEL